MHLLFADNWLSPSLVQSIGWTLIHSLWEGFVAAMIALLMLWATKKSSPVLRYNLLLLLLGFFVVAVVMTFLIQYDGRTIEKVDTALSASLQKEPSQTNPNVSLTIGEHTKNYYSGFESLVNTHATLVVGIWFAMLCIQCLRLTFSLGYIYRIKRYRTYVPSLEWQELCAGLKKSLCIQRDVKLMESGIVKVPLVVGFFKPLILLPVGLLANLPYNQVESILLHELAHIQRSDYLVNLMQTMIETVFFFNPAVRWISALVKEEREACCDAMAISHLDSTSHYLQALVSFQEYTVNPSRYALAFPGRKDHLLWRVKRIIHNENKKLTSMEKTLLFCGIVAIAAVSLFSTKESKAQKEVHKTVVVPANSNLDTIPDKSTISKTTKKKTRTSVATDDDGTNKVVLLETNDMDGMEAKARFESNSLTELSINGKSIDPKQFSLYEVKVKAIIDEQQRQSSRTEQHVHQQETQIANLKSQTRENDAQQTEKVASQRHRSAAAAQPSLLGSGSEDSHEQVEDMIQLLKGAGVIDGKEGTTFKLTYNELIVNGVRQAEELHKTLKQKYIYRQGDYYTFLSSKGTTDITVHRAD